jgi:hypothetical protein
MTGYACQARGGEGASMSINLMFDLMAIFKALFII